MIIMFKFLLVAPLNYETSKLEQVDYENKEG